jgi:hypothetical protein
LTRVPVLDWRVSGSSGGAKCSGYFRERSQPLGGLSRTILWLVILGFGLGASLREIEGYTYASTSCRAS